MVDGKLTALTATWVTVRKKPPSPPLIWVAPRITENHSNVLSVHAFVISVDHFPGTPWEIPPFNSNKKWVGNVRSGISHFSIQSSPRQKTPGFTQYTNVGTKAAVLKPGWGG